MGTKTANFALNQWEPGDNFLRTDFNEDNAKIDAALTLKSELVVGTYTGDGEKSLTIELDFQPKAVYLCTQSGMAGIDNGAYYYTYGGLALPDSPLISEDYGTVMEITATGFQLTASDRCPVNRKNEVYHYFALR